HRNAVTEIVYTAALAGTTQTPSHEQVIVTTAVKQHGCLDLACPSQASDVGALATAVRVQREGHDAVPEAAKGQIRVAFGVQGDVRVDRVIRFVALGADDRAVVRPIFGRGSV